MRLCALAAAALALGRGVLGSGAPLWIERELCLTDAPYAAVEERLATGARAYTPTYALQVLSDSPLSPTPLLLVSLDRCSAAQMALPPCNGPRLVRLARVRPSSVSRPGADCPHTPPTTHPACRAPTGD
jgi:hypothetical protein